MLPTSLLASLFLLLSLTSAAAGPRRRQRRSCSSNSQKSFLAAPPATYQNTTGNTGTTNTNSGTGSTNAGTGSTGSGSGSTGSGTGSTGSGAGSTGSGTGSTNADISSTTSTTNSTMTTDGSSLVVSFTRYGTGDIMGSSNCATSAGACGSHGMGGYTAAISQNLFGSPSSGTPGSACGECWSLTANGGKAVVVKVDNECPAQGNSMCAQQTVEDVNQVGGHANFDLCIDSGAADAVMGSGVGEAMGTAVKMESC